jgi:hypothetical protein
MNNGNLVLRVRGGAGSTSETYGVVVSRLSQKCFHSVASLCGWQKSARAAEKVAGHKEVGRKGGVQRPGVVRSR